MTGRSYRIWLGAILLLALAVRAPFIRAGTVQADLALVGDEGNYVFNAAAILDGRLAEQDLALPWMRGPLVPLSAAAAALLTGSNPAWTIAPLIALNLLLGVALVTLTAAIARRLAGERAALLAALGMALLPAWIIIPQQAMSETLYTVLLVWAAFWLLRAPAERPYRHWAAAGALLGLAALCRSTALTILPLLILAGWCQVPGATGVTIASGTQIPLERVAARHPRPRGSWRIRLFAAALMALSLALVVAPWTLRNAVVHGGFIALDTTGAYNLWQDNSILPRPELKAQVLAQPGPVERQAYAAAAARREILGDPGRFAAKAWRALLRAPLPEPATGYRDEWLRFYPDRSPAWAEIHAIGSALGYALLMPLALLGGMVLWRKQRLFVVLAVLLSAHYLVQTMSTHYAQRFLAPLFPLYVALAAVAVAAWWRARLTLRIGRKPWLNGLLDNRPLALLGLFAATAAFWAASWPYNREALAMARADWFWWRGADCADGDDLGNLLRAAELVPRANWRLTTDLGRCQSRLGEPTDGIATLWRAVEQAAALEQPAADAHAALVAAYRAAGDPAAARQAQDLPVSGQLALLEWGWASPPPPAATIDIGGLDLGYLRGFWGGEAAPGGRTYRWMGERGALRFPGCAPGLHALTLAAASGHPAGSEARLTIGGAVSLVLAPEWRQVTAIVPLDASCEIELTAGTWRPLALDRATNDPRALGFELDWAAIAPLGTR